MNLNSSYSTIKESVYSDFDTKFNFSFDGLFHSLQVAEMSLKMARQMNIFDDYELHMIYKLGLLHDIGKSKVNPKIVNKPGVLLQHEWECMKKHPIYGEKLFMLNYKNKLDGHSLSKYSRVIRHHHEHYNGGGYPDKLKGDEIPLMSRIITVADIYSAIISPRTYRKYCIKDPLGVLKNECGKKIDPKVHGYFLSVFHFIK